MKFCNKRYNKASSVGITKSFWEHDSKLRRWNSFGSIQKQIIWDSFKLESYFLVPFSVEENDKRITFEFPKFQTKLV